jgi:hypothetical protein
MLKVSVPLSSGPEYRAPAFGQAEIVAGVGVGKDVAVGGTGLGVDVAVGGAGAGAAVKV